ncbi:MAG: hypothetical protein ABIT05_01355 [Chitinophagaceae bacterium]
MQLPGQADTFIDSIMTRLRVCIDRKKVLLLREQLRKESNKIGFDKKQYIINELLRELRKAIGDHNEAFEMILLKNWTTKIISQYGEDRGLAFYNQVILNRELRR